ncbi:putative transcription factor PosF21 -like protein [Gossypium arboreum]|uniref:Putative transcription factor PosF21-like protein n=1 Tax=Gossypium arboreum TaxID=29729 RepID=A0A0B0N3I0_GOSAR|nr:putative transcription factor PosF21 -like protein [Gossypium arboreum]
MEKDKSPCLPPMSGRVPGFSSSGNAANTSNTISETGNLGQTSDSNRFSHDISKMPDNPPKNLGHRRAHSEIITLPDDINFDGDLGVVGAADGPSYSDETEDDMLSMYLDIDKFNSSSVTSMFQVGKSSAMTAPNSGPSAAVSMGAGTATSGEENASAGVGYSEKPRIRHQHSQSMDGSTSIKPEMLLSGSDEVTPADSKKAMSAAKLAELALIDPKRAKRIWANRQSAARSKERKMRYIAELERKIQTLQTEATSLTAQLTLLQKDSSGMSAENSELKLRLQTMEQQVYLQDCYTFCGLLVNIHFTLTVPQTVYVMEWFLNLKGRAAVEALDRDELVVRALFAYDAYKVPI